MFITKVSKQDVERSSTLEKADIGKWAIVVNGAWHIGYDSEAAAAAAYKEIYQ